MPPVQISTEESSAFTIIDHEEQKRDEIFFPLLPRNVNVVKPLKHDDERPQVSSADGDELTEPPPPALAPAPAPAPNTILDPKFSRALDFKLRRLKEKEILQANLRRPTRYIPRNGALAASNPNISRKEPSTQGKAMSNSHPHIDIAGSDQQERVSPKMDKSPSPGAGLGRRARARLAPDGDKPRFVTTVKAGQFLLPPPEIACLLGLETLYPPQERDKIVYSYASKPKAVAPRTKRSLLNRKEENGSATVPNGGAAAATTGCVSRRPTPGEVFGGVRALVAGVVGMAHLLDKPQPGSVGPAQYSNVMHEKRVVRGSTFAAHPHAAGDGLESAAARAARTRRRALARRAAAARLRPGTPPPAPGRRHHPIQTEYYLEELFDKGVELEVGVQTDLFLDRPTTPVYVPAKTGADAHTQIYPGDLFDFELEVQPILEVLVGKTTEQALAEVAQEEELGALREQQRRYCELRDAERAERARLAHQHARLHDEKERRVAEARVAQDAAREARDRAAAQALVQGYVAELLPAVLAGLRDQGYLVERIQRGVDEEFMPWLVTEVSHEIESIITSRDVISEIVRDVVEARAELYRASAEAAAEATRLPSEDSLTPRSSLLEEGEETAVGLEE